MRPLQRRIFTVVGALVAAALVVTGVQGMLERQRTAQEINRLREDLFRARAGADRCRSSLATSETALRDLSLSIESMRMRVDSFEALDRRGVPASEYEDYLELFDSYNDSVAVWEARERRLRATEASCRATIEGHNSLSDSLQQVLEDAGIGGA